MGCLPRSARARLETGLFEPWSRKGSTGWNDWLSTIDSFRAAVAGLIGGRVEEVCPQPGVSTALFRLLSGLPRREGRNVLLASAHAFASMAYVMGQLRPLGYRLELLPESVDPTDPQAWRAAMGPDTAAVLVMHVHSNTGLASPVAEIAAEARAAGAISIIDIAQSAGVLPVNVAAWGADAVVGSCVKWLCGGPGAGFLWVSPALLPQTTPLDAGWFSARRAVRIRHPGLPIRPPTPAVSGAAPRRSRPTSWPRQGSKPWPALARARPWPTTAA